jgi:hypothetical protein
MKGLPVNLKKFREISSLAVGITTYGVTHTAIKHNLPANVGRLAKANQVVGTVIVACVVSEICIQYVDKQIVDFARQMNEDKK